VDNLGGLWIRVRVEKEVSGQLRPLDLRRDFEGISKLVETAFAEDFQRTGLQFREELKLFRRLVPWALVLGRFNKFFRELLGGYVWEDHGQIVGSVVMQPRGLERRKWNISAVATHPDYRRRGIARRLMEAAIEHIRERGGELALLAVHSDNTPAYQLYLGLGFTRFDSVTLLRLDGIPDVEFKPIEGYVVSGYPIIGSDLIVMNCIWVLRKAKGHNFGGKLIENMVLSAPVASGFATIALEGHWSPWFKREQLEKLGFQPLEAITVRHKARHRDEPFRIWLMWMPVRNEAQPPTWNKKRILEGVTFCFAHPLYRPRTWEGTLLEEVKGGAIG